jgi:hypothetical protein
MPTTPRCIEFVTSNNEFNKASTALNQLLTERDIAVSLYTQVLSLINFSSKYKNTNIVFLDKNNNPYDIASDLKCRLGNDLYEKEYPIKYYETKDEYVTKNLTILQCIELFIDEFISKEPSHVSGFTNTNNNFKTNHKKDIFRVLVSNDIISDDISKQDGFAQKSIIKNIQGKIKSKFECYGLHMDEYESHKKQYEDLIKQIKLKGFVDCISKAIKNNLIGKKLSLSDELTWLYNMKAIVSGVARDTFEASVIKSNKSASDDLKVIKVKYIFTSELWNFFKDYVSDITTIIHDDQFMKLEIKNDKEITEVSILEMVNECLWLNNHKEGIKNTEYFGNDYGLMLSNIGNYHRINDFTVYDDYTHKHIHVSTNDGIDVSFTLGPKNKCEYWAKIEIEPEVIKGVEHYRVTQTRRKFSSSEKKYVLYKISGLCKEPKIELIRAKSGNLLKLVMPINADTPTENKGEYEYLIDDKKIMFNSTVLAPTVELTSEYFKGATVLGFDYGENENVASAIKFNNTSIDTISRFEANKNANLLNSTVFMDYLHNKYLASSNKKYIINGNSYDCVWSNDLSVFVDGNHVSYNSVSKNISYLRRLLSLTRQLCTTGEYWLPSYNRLRECYKSNMVDLGLDDISDDFEHTMSKCVDLVIESHKQNGVINYDDLRADPNWIVVKIKNIIMRRFKTLKNARNTIYLNQHHCDCGWIKVISDLISVLKSFNYLGSTKDSIISSWKIEYIDELNKYLDNVKKQYRKELASWLRDEALDNDCKVVAVESLKANNYISEDSESNRKRSLMAPAELQKDIQMALEIVGIPMVKIKEDLTSRTEFGTRLLGARNCKLGWHDLHVCNDQGDIKKVPADINASCNIALQAYLGGSALPKIWINNILTNKLGNQAIQSLLYGCYITNCNDSEFINLISLTKIDSSMIKNIMPILQTHIESQIGDSLEHTMKSIKYNKYVYVHGDTWITQDQKRKIQNAIELKMVS